MTFQFKQFNVKHEQCAFKVGMDSVLLGSWADVDEAKRILDIGTGSGILALMMAQKSKAEITAIDIDKGAFDQANENFLASPWSERICVSHSSLQDFALTNPEPFDLIISNPPYFREHRNQETTARSTARSTGSLQFQELIECARKLLCTNGKLYIVLPTNEAKEFRLLAEKNGFVLSGLLRVQTKPGEKYEKRHLMRLENTAFRYTENILIVENEQHLDYTEEYRSLTRDFYLAF